MAKIQAVWALDIGQAALKALKLVPGETPDQVDGRGVRLRRVSQDPQPARRRPRAAGPRGAGDVPGPQRPEGVQGRHRRARARRAWSSSSSCRRSRRSGSPTSSSSRPGSRSPSPSRRSSGPTSRSATTRRASDEDFTMAEVGLFAMKRDQINRAILPFRVAGIEVDIVQMGPIALYNFITFDQIKGSDLQGLGRPARHRRRQHRPDHHRRHPDLAAERADRRQPLHPGPDQGAEAHLRQGRAPEAERHQGPRPPVDLHRDAGRLQRLRQRGQPLDRVLLERQPRRPKIAKVIGLGNGFKLPGLQKFLQQNLSHEVEKLEAFARLVGDEVKSAARSSRRTCRRSPSPTAWPCRGWAGAALRTNLLPPEIEQVRLIRAQEAVGAGGLGAADARLLGAVPGRLPRPGQGRQRAVQAGRRRRPRASPSRGRSYKTRLRRGQGRVEGEVRARASRWSSTPPTAASGPSSSRPINAHLPDPVRDYKLDPNKPEDQHKLDRLRVHIDAIKPVWRTDVAAEWFNDAAVLEPTFKNLMHPLDRATPPSRRGLDRPDRRPPLQPATRPPRSCKLPETSQADRVRPVRLPHQEDPPRR